MARASLFVQFAVGLMSAAAVVLEVALTRIFSFTLGYHYVFVLVGLAVFGLGVGAAMVHWLGLADRPAPALAAAPLLAASAGVATTLAVFFAAPVAASGAPLLLLLVGGTPFLPAGGALALLFTRHAEQSGRLYRADMAAAAFGAVLAVVALSLGGGLAGALLAGVLFAVAGLLLLAPGGRDTLLLAVGATAITLAAFLGQVSLGLVYLPASAAGSEKTMPAMLRDERMGATIEWSRWDAFSRTDVASATGTPDEKVIFIDGGAGSLMHRFDGDLTAVADLRDTAGYYPFAVRQPGRVLTIGPGGGVDILLALLAGAKDITAVEINPGTVEAMHAFAGFNGNLYDRPEVQVVVDEGRSYLRRSQQKYDTIYLSLVMAQAAERPGLALSENYVYTVEAIQDYLAHLQPGGKIAFRLHDGVDLGRAFANVLAALERGGKSPAQAAAQVVLYYDARPGAEHNHSGYSSPVMLVFSSPIAAAEGERIEADLRARGLEPLLVPHAVSVEPYARVAAGTSTLAEFIRRWYYDISPTYDDRPFFFEVGRGPSPQVTSMALLLLFVGLLGWLAFSAAACSKSGQVRHLVVYFLILGAGFMLVETASIQRLTLFLGHPTLAVATSLAALLLAAGWGGLATQRIPQERLRQAMAVATLAIGLATTGWGYLASFTTSAFLTAELPVRIALACGLLAPLGFLLGAPFPLGLRLAASRGQREPIPIYWAANGFGAITGSVLGMAMAQAAGFGATLSLGAIMYLATGAVIVASSLVKPSAGDECAPRHVMRMDETKV